MSVSPGLNAGICDHGKCERLPPPPVPVAGPVVVEEACASPGILDLPAYGVHLELRKLMHRLDGAPLPMQNLHW